MRPSLPLESQELWALSRRYCELARHVSAGIDQNNTRWRTAFAHGVRGEAFTAAGGHEDDLQVPAAAVASTMLEISAVLDAVAPIQHRLEELLGDVLRSAEAALVTSASVAAVTQPIYSQLILTIKTGGIVLDLLCAQEITRIASASSEPGAIQLSDLSELSSGEVDAFQRVRAPEDVINLLADHPDAHLLEVSDGRLVVAFGDIDTADSITTVVAGVGSSDSTSWPGYLTKAQTIAQKTGGASVMWLGYNAPSSVPLAAVTSPARHGGYDLRSFQSALRQRAAARKKQQRLVVLGHSYGSTVVGTAARDGTLAADAVVFAGSPGVGVNQRSQLHLDNPHGEVIGSLGFRDPIAFTSTPLFGAHGMNPASPLFGGSVWRSMADHDDYWTDPEFLRRLKETTHGSHSR